MPAFSPQDVADTRVATFPDAVLEVINGLLVKHYRGVGAEITFNLEEAKNALLEKFPESSPATHGWLDFEAVYRAAGWKVTFDSPSIGDNYKAYYSFRKA
jgi:hypothetical protein